MKIQLLLLYFLIPSIPLFAQQQLELSNIPNNSPTTYPYNFIFPLASDLLQRNSYQLTGNQLDLDNATPFQVYYERDTLSFAGNHLDIANNPVLMAGKAVLLKPGFQVASGAGSFIVTLEKKLADYDIDTDGQQTIDNYDPDFRLRYFMSIFGPRLILRNGVYRYDFHQGSDIINKERPEDNVPTEDLPNFQCMCDGTVAEFVKLDNPADINNPNGVGRRTGIHCSGDAIVEPPMGDNSLILEDTGEGQYLVVKCAEQYPVGLGFSNNDIYIAYRHLYSFAQNFNIGDPIKKGDLIGKMGQSGITSNYHLHFSALRRACSEMPAKRFINVHPMLLFNPEYNPHLLRKLEVNNTFDNASSPIKYQEFNPEVYFLNYDTITPNANPIIRIALPYYHASIKKIIIRDKNGLPPTNEWVFDFTERGIENEAERDKNHWDMNGDGLLDTVFIHHFNRGTSASFLYNSHKDEAHFEGHPGSDWPINAEKLFRMPAYILDLKIVNFLGPKADLEVEIFDIWRNGIKGVVPANAINDFSLSKRNVSLLNHSNVNSIKFDFKLSPNPSINQLVQLELITQEKLSTSITVRIFNELGQEVYQQKATNKRSIYLNLRHLRKGIYVVQVGANNQMLNKKLVLY